VTTPLQRSLDRRRRRRAPLAVRAAALLVAAAAFFLAGLGLGQALDDSPDPGGEQTLVRTLKPLPVAPARETVTVTVTVP
jgi:hypothetical protein